ncbi:hypothetical protein N7488_005761 [Penicillium malachiteum]|nr:hypothetical protein N7488_005761 [Penicillium malachiteum]
MRQRFELGQCLLHDTTSQIQLQFAAAATLSRPQNSNFKDSPIPYWPDPLSTWIKEAPEIEMSLSLSFGSEIAFISSHSVKDLQKRLCNSVVWSELGFTITCKGHNISTKPDFSGEVCLILGLIRDISKPVIEKTRNLPAVLQNLPDIPPPQAIPVISLAIIEIFMECNYLTGTEESYHESDLLFGYEEPPSSFQDGLPSQALYIDPMTALGSNSLVYSQEPVTNHGMPHQHDIDQFSESFLDLMDFGLQRLIVSPSFKTSHIQTHGDSLRNLRELAPATFNPKYREAVNQRAASIPVITKAINSMLKNSSNADFQPQIAHLPQERMEWIRSSLWCKSQTLLPRPGPPRRRNKFFPPRLPANSPRANIDADVAMPFTDNISGFDEEILELDNDWEDIDINHRDLGDIDDFIHTDIEEESDELLLRSCSQASFQDLYESTQTTLDSHQSSLEEVSSSSSQTDTEMLFYSLEHG